MQQLGQVLVLVTFAWTAFTVVLAIDGAVRDRADRVRASSMAARAVAWLNVAISLALLHGLLTHDFSSRYVSSYTDAGMPVFYLLTAFWGGEKGALMFWVLSLSLLAGVVGTQRARDGSRETGWVNAVLAIALLFFDVLMVFASNPFETFLTQAPPPDGNGLNPLLQNPLMAVHPPFQLAGFIAYTVPFAFAVAAVLSGRTDGAWLRQARPWYLFAWTTLSAGLVIGGLWAYLELGWGGFWGWDPVENAALLPWLAGTAFLHTASTEHRQGLFRRFNLVLVSLTFFLTIFATFLTRSQLIQSLHSFSNSVLTPFFLYYQLFLVAFLIAVLAWRWRAFRPARRIERLWSREFLVVLNAVTFLVAAFVVLWGTLLPKISESPAVQDLLNAVIGGLDRFLGLDIPPLTKAVDVGPDWFNKVVSPIGVAILALTAIAPLVPLRSARGPAVGRGLRRTGLVSLAVAFLAALAFVAVRGGMLADLTDAPFLPSCWQALRVLGLEGVWAFLVLVFAAWVLAVAVVDTAKSVAARRRVTRESAVVATAGLFRANPRRFGGHVIHVGVALSFLGFAGGAGKLVKKDVEMKPGDRITLAGYDLVFAGTRATFVADGPYASLASEVLVWPRGDRLPDAALEAARAALGSAGTVEGGEAPEVGLRFPSPDAARSFLLSTSLRMAMAGDIARVRVDPAAREVSVQPADGRTLRIVPRTFHRIHDRLQSLARAVGPERLSVRAARGDPVIVLKAGDETTFAALEAGVAAGAAPAWATVHLDRADAAVVRAIPAGVATSMWPEVRYYLKSENPTTEVSIRTGVLTDLYLASTPGDGSESMILTAMWNPLTSGLWIGAVVIVVAGLVMAAPGRRGRGREREVAAAAPVPSVRGEGGA